MSTIETKENKIMEGEVDITKPCVSTILNEVYPEWKEDSPLPPDLLSICMEYLIAEKKMYHKNGSIASHGFMVNGKMYGVWKTWYTSKNSEMNGMILTQCVYNIFGKQTGQVLSWNPSDGGRLYMVENRVNGVLHGITKQWGRHKNLILEESYENGLRNGEYKRWDIRESILLEHLTYVNGELHGPFKRWYGGRLKESGVYVKGKMLEIVEKRNT